MIERKLKKNSVALDIVNFDEENEGKPKKLEALVAAVNNNDRSRVMHIHPGPSALFDVLISRWWWCCRQKMHWNGLIEEKVLSRTAASRCYYDSQQRPNAVNDREEKGGRREEKGEGGCGGDGRRWRCCYNSQKRLDAVNARDNKGGRGKRRWRRRHLANLSKPLAYREIEALQTL
ncbi:unnamed protein product [Fraxinus pennsylvanica]|uniref:Uncharacterized protein n=1 Tax=Fraxinus pennsylvanica TaxID=56036 RepID=A0AAD2DPD5_9LAMI|nr:unnamed protein product [Fraxinus pennsylvanica]